MKAVILAGGKGTRISEETEIKPKPMVEIGGKPILWHILKTYSHHGINDFVICLGYKGYVLKEYFANYFLHNSDVTFDLKKNSMEVHQNHVEPWKVTLVNTGLDTLTGGRLKRIQEYVKDETFLMTYGDGVGNVDIRKTIEFHREHKKAATITTTQPPGRFGQLRIESNQQVTEFQEKPRGDGGWINGGFFVLEPKIFDYITDDQTIWERTPLEKLSQSGNLMAYQHHGFWLPMDTLRDKNHLEDLWTSGKAPWKVW